MQPLLVLQYVANVFCFLITDRLTLINSAHTNFHMLVILSPMLARLFCLTIFIITLCDTSKVQCFGSAGGLNLNLVSVPSTVLMFLVTSDPGQLAQYFASHFATVSTNHTATGAARLKSTGWAKKTAPNYSCNNFGKYGPIFTRHS